MRDPIYFIFIVFHFFRYQGKVYFKTSEKHKIFFTKKQYLICIKQLCAAKVRDPFLRTSKFYILISENMRPMFVQQMGEQNSIVY